MASPSPPPQTHRQTNMDPKPHKTHRKIDMITPSTHRQTDTDHPHKYINRNKQGLPHPQTNQQTQKALFIYMQTYIHIYTYKQTYTHTYKYRQVHTHRNDTQTDKHIQTGRYTSIHRHRP